MLELFLALLYVVAQILTIHLQLSYGPYVAPLLCHLQPPIDVPPISKQQVYLCLRSQHLAVGRSALVLPPVVLQALHGNKARDVGAVWSVSHPIRGGVQTFLMGLAAVELQMGQALTPTIAYG